MPRAGKESDLRRVLYGMVIVMMMMVDRDSMARRRMSGQWCYGQAGGW